MNPMQRKYVKVFAICFYGLVSALILLCSSNLNPMAGSASQSGNGMVTGMIVSNNDAAKNGILITLRGHNYDPISNSRSDSVFTRTAVTDENGLYKIDTVPADTYTIEGSSPVTGQKLLHFDVIINKNDTNVLQTDTLKALGKIRVYLPDTLQNPSGYVYIPGTSFGGVIDTSAIKRRYLEIDSVPAGQLSGIYYAVNSSFIPPRLLRDNITVIAGETVPITFFDWSYSRKLILNTTASGADISGTITNFPVLIGLNASTFNFSTAKSHGEDIRFTKSDGVALPYEIEQWDAALQIATIWVKVDTVYGNDDSHFIMMYWGNPAANENSNSTEVFDTTAGFQGVWHLNEDGNTNAKDATGNHYDGTPSDTTPAGTQGAIGICRSFNGLSNYLRMNGTADSKLNFQENDTYTISAWAYADTLDNASHLIVGKGDVQYFMKFKTSVVNSPMVWEFVEFHDNTGWNITNSLPSVQPSKEWVSLVGVRRGAAQYLYVNGELIDSTISISPSSVSRDANIDVTIGRFLSAPSDSVEGISPFSGKIDEVRISNVECSADWIKLCYMNQKEQNALVKW
jgi:hypothetical protein